MQEWILLREVTGSWRRVLALLSHSSVKCNIVFINFKFYGWGIKFFFKNACFSSLNYILVPV